ncbi:hypothetical protein [Bacillus cereus]|uniref:Uncharacterized protein n=1 Tax=Bacillus cereus TaxID=1396 RepID=A0A2B1KAD6_BACCE|nr:hypothetical protein [Bacillus cereus]PFN20468.1 hypothetical protein COJ50_21625 [Bacillus cereus]
MNIKNITHISLKKAKNEIQVYTINSYTKEKELISVNRKNLNMDYELSQAILFIQSKYVPSLIDTKIIDTIITNYTEHQVTSLLITESLYRYFDKEKEITFDLKTQSNGMVH